MWPPDFHVLVKHEHYRDYRAEVEQDRLAAMLGPAPLHRGSVRRRLHDRIARRAGLPLGRALVRLGLRLLALGAAIQVYGAGETPPHRPG
jgi:hypothetical protein